MPLLFERIRVVPVDVAALLLRLPGKLLSAGKLFTTLATGWSVILRVDAYIHGSMGKMLTVPVDVVVKVP